jgi:hypothetical protein
VSTKSGRDDDVEVVLTGGPASGAGVGTGRNRMTADGGVDAPAREYVAVSVRDGEHLAGVVGIDDAPRPSRQRYMAVDTLQEGRVHEGVRYRDDSSLDRGEHATALGRDAADKRW